MASGDIGRGLTTPIMHFLDEPESEMVERGLTPFIQPIDSPGFTVGEFIKDPHFAEEQPGIVIFKHGLTDITKYDLIDKDGASKCVGYVEPKTEE